jgi:hypothetical protein
MPTQLVPMPAEMRLVPRSQWDHKRRDQRYQCCPATLARVTATDSADTLHGWVLNLSVKGAGVLLAKPLQSGTLFVLQVKNTAGDRCYELPGCVVHATIQGTGDWLVGCEFADSLSADDLEALL